MNINDLNLSQGQTQISRRSEYDFRTKEVRKSPSIQTNLLLSESQKSLIPREKNLSTGLYTPRAGFPTSFQNFSNEELQTIIQGKFQSNTPKNSQVPPLHIEQQKFKELREQQLQQRHSERNLQSPLFNQSISQTSQNKSEEKGTVQTIYYYQFQNTQLKKELDDMRKQIQELSSQRELEISSLKSQMVKLQDFHMKEKYNLQRKLQQEIDFILQDKQEASNFIESLQLELSKSKSLLESTIQSKINLESQLNQIDEDLQRNLQESQRDKRNQKAIVQETQNLIEQESKKQQILQLQINQLQNDKKLLAERLENSETRNVQANQEIQNLKSFIQDNLPDLNYRIEEMQTQSIIQKEKNQKTIQTITKENNELKTQNKNLSNQAQLYKKQKREYLVEINQLKKQNQIIQSRQRNLIQQNLSNKTLQASSNKNKVRKEIPNRIKGKKRNSSKKSEMTQRQTPDNLQMTSRAPRNRSQEGKSFSLQQSTNYQDQDLLFPYKSLSPKMQIQNEEVEQKRYLSQKDFYQSNQNQEDIDAAISQAEEQLEKKQEQYKDLLQKSKESNVDLSQVRNQINKISCEIENISDVLHMLKRKQLKQLSIIQKIFQFNYIKRKSNQQTV